MKFNLVLMSALLLVIGTNGTYIPNFNKVIHKDFDWKLTKEILNDGCKDCNTVISPYSIKMLLSLISYGINPASISQHEISKAVSKFSMQQEEFHYYMTTLASLNKPSNEYSVSLASEVCYDKTVSISNIYKALIQQVYKANVKQLDFTDAANSAAEINKFVSQQTKGHINNFITPDKVREVKALLLNAVFFDGKWEHPFPKRQIISRNFSITPDEVIPVKMMFRLNKEYYYTNSKALNAKITRLDYKGNKYAMNIILPNKPDGLQSVIEKLNAETLYNELSNMEKSSITIGIPKFKFDYSTKLKKNLRNLGIRQVFTGNADIEELKSSNSLQLSDVVQKVEIAVTEDGTTATAATVAEMTERSGSRASVIAKHPFLFFIEDVTTGVILFAGKVQRPEFK